MKVSEIYKEKQNKACSSKKSLSFEIFPPKKDSELKNIDETLAVLCELEPDYISVTFGAGMSYALSQIIDLLVNDIDGIHLYTMNNPLVARRICEGIRNII